MSAHNAKNAFKIARDVRRKLAQFPHGGAESVRMLPSFDKGATIILARRLNPEYQRAPYSTHRYINATGVIVSGVYDMDYETAAQNYDDRCAEMLGGA